MKSKLMMSTSQAAEAEENRKQEALNRVRDNMVSLRISLAQPNADNDSAPLDTRCISDLRINQLCLC